MAGFIEDELIQELAYTLGVYRTVGSEHVHPCGHIILSLFLDPSLDQDLHKNLSRFISKYRRQGMSSFQVVLKLLALTGNNLLLDLLASSRWFWRSYLESDRALISRPLYNTLLAIFVQRAPVSLRQDKTFMMRLLEEDASMLRHASVDLQGDDELALKLFAGPRSSIKLYLQEDGNGFNRPIFALGFHRRLQEKLDTHDAFCKIFVFGVTDTGSQISLLSQGFETSTAYKKLIAEFIGLPIGRTLSLIRRADENLDALHHILLPSTKFPVAPPRFHGRPRPGNRNASLDELVRRVSETPQAPINRRGPRRRCRR